MTSTTSPATKTTDRRFKTLRTISALVLREMSATYGTSPGGYIWAVLQPVAALTLMTFVFTLALRKPSLGTNFPLFYATGYFPFQLFNSFSNKTAGSLKYSAQLLRYPSVKYTDAIIARFVLNFLTSMMVFYIVMTAIIWIYRLPVNLDVPAIIQSFVLASFFGLSLGSLNCVFVSLFPVWKQLWSVVTTPLFILSTVLYSYENVPAAFRGFIWYNPIVHTVGLMRRGFYPTYDATYVSVTYVLGVSLVLLLFGLVFLKRYYRDILNL